MSKPNFLIFNISSKKSSGNLELLGSLEVIDRNNRPIKYFEFSDINFDKLFFKFLPEINDIYKGADFIIIYDRRFFKLVLNWYKLIGVKLYKSLFASNKKLVFVDKKDKDLGELISILREKDYNWFLSKEKINLTKEIPFLFPEVRKEFLDFLEECEHSLRDCVEEYEGNPLKEEHLEVIKNLFSSFEKKIKTATFIKLADEDEENEENQNQKQSEILDLQYVDFSLYLLLKSIYPFFLRRYIELSELSSETLEKYKLGFLFAKRFSNFSVIERETYHHIAKTNLYYYKLNESNNVIFPCMALKKCKEGEIERLDIDIKKLLARIERLIKRVKFNPTSSDTIQLRIFLNILIYFFSIKGEIKNNPLQIWEYFNRFIPLNEVKDYITFKEEDLKNLFSKLNENLISETFGYFIQKMFSPQIGNKTLGKIRDITKEIKKISWELKLVPNKHILLYVVEEIKEKIELEGEEREVFNEAIDLIRKYTPQRLNLPQFFNLLFSL